MKNKSIFAMLIISLLIATAFSGCIGEKEAGLKPYQNPDLPVEKRINDLLGRMTLEEKTCQMATLYGLGRALTDELPTGNGMIRYGKME